MMAHDLRNPLAAILGKTEFINSLVERHAGELQLTQKVQSSSEDIVSTVERMDRLIASCLKQASDDATKLQIEMSDFPLARASDIAVSLNGAAAFAKSITINYLPPSDIIVHGDEDRLTEAMDNLINNAIKYSNVGQSIHVEARNLKNGTEISVRDYGLGLTPQDRLKAFRNFQRLSAQPTAGETSTGLGLAIVKAIIDAHNGQIQVKSKGKGFGATFTIVLPHR